MKRELIIFLFFVVLGFFMSYLVYFLINSLSTQNTSENLGQDEIQNIYNHEEDVFESGPIKITFVGDIMVDRHIRKIADRNSHDYLFDKVRDRLNSANLVVANLEGTVTDFPSISNSEIEHERFVFTFDPLIIKALEKANIKIVSIDNNHITDRGMEGLNQTVKYLNNSNVDYFGNPYDKQILYKQYDQFVVAFVSYNQFINPDLNEVKKLIIRANEVADHVVVYTHWGNEYEMTANQNQISLAHQFIDNGADLIIGSHPHVVQNKEIYKERHIYYSLGNFIFDQYFTDDVSCGAVVTFEFDKNEIKLISEEFVKLDPVHTVSFSDCKISVGY
jgi:gamma-polyglutamate biosynthesis protein CapA